MLRPARALATENLVLRRQLALYRERGIKPRRVDPATRARLAFLTRFIDWRAAVIVVRPETIVRWHRAGFRLLWRWKSRPGRPPIPIELRRLIRRMARKTRSGARRESPTSYSSSSGFRCLPAPFGSTCRRDPPDCRGAVNAGRAFYETKRRRFSPVISSWRSPPRSSSSTSLS